VSHLGVDVGGTFTDLILYDEADRHIHVHKLPSTPHDPAVAIMQGVREVCVEAAKRDYGVAIDLEREAVNEARTAELRAR
jgi:N-methylhydantoinase A